MKRREEEAKIIFIFNVTQQQSKFATITSPQLINPAWIDRELQARAEGLPRGPFHAPVRERYASKDLFKKIWPAEPVKSQIIEMVFRVKNVCMYLKIVKGYRKSVVRIHKIARTG